MKTQFKRYARPLLGLCISAALLWQLLHHIDLGQVRSTLAAAQAGPLLGGLMLVVLGFALRAWRWHAMVVHFSSRVRFRDSGAVFLSSFALNNTLPLRAGDLARTFMFTKELQTPPATLAATLLIERLLDAGTLVLLLCLGLWAIPADRLPPQWQGWLQQAGFLLACAAVGGLLALFVLPKLLMWVLGHFAHTPRGAKLQAIMQQFADAFGLLRDPRLLGQLLLLSLLSWVVEGGVFWAAGQALQVSLPDYAPWFALSTATLATLIPGTPGHLGTFDYFAVLGLGVYGIDASAAASMAFVVHLLLWLPVTVVGGGLLLRRQGAGALQKIHDLEKEQA